MKNVNQILGRVAYNLEDNLNKDLHMGHRSIIVLLCAFLAFASADLMALGLGNIKLDSSLNQPLVAEIELFEVRELQREEIRVAIASAEDFKRIGVDKVFFLSDLAFDVVVSGDSSHIKVSSTKSVKEPFLNFVLEVKWPSGKLLREYTLLLDLPAFSGAPAPAVESTFSPPAKAAAERQPSQSSTYRPRSAYAGAPARPSFKSVSPTYTDSSYQVKAKDTLWEIASSVRPDGSISIHQTMIAIQRSNPSAFIRNNINLLKQGQILRIPDRDEMASLSQREAVGEVAAQHSAWSGNSSFSDKEVSEAQLSGTDAYNDYESGTDAPEGRLKLSSPDESYTGSEGRSGSGGGGEVSSDALENELAITLEQLDKSSRENDELKSKVSSLEEQISTMERMLEVTNRGMKELELQAKKNDAARAEAAAALEEQNRENLDSAQDEVADILASDSGVAKSPDAELESAKTPASPQLADATPAPTAAPVEDKAKENKRSKVVSAPSAKGTSLVDIILNNILYIVGGLVAIAAIAFAVMRKKSADDDEDFDDFMDERELTSDSSDMGLGAEDPFDDDDSFHGLGDEPQETTTEFDEGIDQEQDHEPDSEAQTEDVVAEADIYIAYGKYDQAEEMLVKSLDADPNDENVRLKLMEVYSSQGDVESFDPLFAKLRQIASPAMIERAETLRNNIPNVSDFDESQVGGLHDMGAEDSDSVGSFDLDLPGGDSDDGSVDFGSGSEDSGLDLDEDLSFDSSFDSDAASLDFDLDDDADETQELDSIGSDIDLSINLDSSAPGGDSLDLDDEIDLSSLSDGMSSLSDSDTVVNEALDDDYIEQKRAEDAGDGLSLGDLDGPMTGDEDDFDLSSLDDELDALTSGMDTDQMHDVEGLDDLVAQKSATSSSDMSFDEAIAEVPSSDNGESDFELPDINPDGAGDDDLEFLSDSDETATKLDLARAYIDMGDQEGARDIIREVMGEGNDEQKSEAQGLLARIDA